MVRALEIVSAEAVDAAFEAGDLDRAAELVEEAGRALYAGRLRIPLDRLEGWLAKLRAGIDERPWLLFCQSWVWNSQRRIALAAVALTRAERLFASQPDSPERARGLVLVKLAQGVVAERAADFAAAREAFAAAREHLGAPARAEPWIGPDAAARWRSRDPSGAAGFYVEAIPALRAVGEPLWLARALNNFAHELLRRGEPALARHAALESVELKRGLDADASLAHSLNTLGVTEMALGLYDLARSTFAEACELAERGGHALIHAYATNNLAEVERDGGDVRLANDLYERSVAEKEALRDEFGVSYGLRSWATAKRRAGALEEATSLLERALRLREPLVDPHEIAQFDLERGLQSLARGDAQAARGLLAAARRVADETDAKGISSVASLALAAMDRDASAVDGALAEAARYQLGALARPELDFLRRLDPSLRPREDGVGRALPAVRAWVFGDLRVEVGGRMIDLDGWRSKRAAELVRIFVAHRHASVGRDELLEWLWPGEEDAVDKLNTAVNTARRGLEEAGGPGPWIVRSGDRYRLAHLVWVDAERFLSLWQAARAAIGARDPRRARERLTEALSLARGDPYERDRYAEWAAPERTRLVELVQLAREKLAGLELELGRPDEAIVAALDAIGAEPSRESAHQLVIRAHLARGDRASALRAFAACRDALGRELGVAPGADTAALIASATI